MTAEIAILNKSAVALATDSAVTISSGNRHQKIFDSADKLFELSHFCPIGVMIFNGMSFAEIPLQSLIKSFRTKSGKFKTVKSAAMNFLEFLHREGISSPKKVKDDSLKRILQPFLNGINDRVQQNFRKAIEKSISNEEREHGEADDFTKILSDIVDNILNEIESVFDGEKNADFIGDGDLEFDENSVNVIEEMARSGISGATDQQKEKLVELSKTLLKKAVFSSDFTGIVVAGFGDEEIFPTLISFEIDGMVCDRLKYKQTNFIDIDRSGPRASVLPFAQKEMVERFLYGLDDEIQSKVGQFCSHTVPSIRKKAVEGLRFSNDADRMAFEAEIASAEQAFIDGLHDDAFSGIRSESQTDIEDMVEFMPKPELATMAEALVNLTSLKRRVSKGMETVGGPIDVAVISQSEGFVWVKRKHYFPSELNARYLQRVSTEMENKQKGKRHAKDSPN